jgi:hypothetical protein
MDKRGQTWQGILTHKLLINSSNPVRITLSTSGSRLLFLVLDQLDIVLRDLLVFLQ